MKKKRKGKNKKGKKSKSRAFPPAQGFFPKPITDEDEKLPLPFKDLVDFSEIQKDPERFEAWRKQLLGWLKQEAAELENLILQYNSFDLIANLMVTQLPIDYETYDNSTHSGLAAIVEYVALLFLKHPFNKGQEIAIGQVPLQEIDNKVRSIHLMTGFYYGHDKMASFKDGEAGAFNSLRYRLMSSEMTIRSPGYDHHQREILLSLFTLFDDWLTDKLGFTALDILKIEDTIPLITGRRLSARYKEAERAEESLLRDVQRFRRKRYYNSSYDMETLQEFAKLPKKIAKTQIKNSSIGWLFSFLGTACFSFNAEEIATESNLPLARVEAALKFFSLEFGSIPSDFFLFSPTHELRGHPVIHHQGIYLYPSPSSMIWALQQRLESVLNPNSLNSIGDAKIWLKYEKNRSNYLEQETLRLLGATLQTSEIYSKLTYSILENGLQKHPELDGLIAYDRTLFLIEAKAGTLSIPARRGGPDRIKKSVTELLGKAHEQALRAQNYIENTELPSFFREDGTEIPFNKKRFDRIFTVTVTLQPMDVFNASLHELVRAGLIKDAQLPWAVSLANLRVISEINEFPTQFIH